MGSSSWEQANKRARSARTATARGPRPAGSWSAAIERARDAWDDLTGGPGVGPCDCRPGRQGARVHDLGCASVQPARYSEGAAAAILSTALGLWSDTGLLMGGDGPGQGDGPEV
jgi:hypothetical protein